MIGFDTMVVIYHIENDPRYGPLCEAFLRHVELGIIAGVTSVITLSETLVQPLRMHDTEIADSYLAFLTQSPHLHLMALGPAIGVGAAALRSKYGIELTDAFQVAAALEAGATGFLTNDRRLAQISEIDVLVLEDCLPTPPEAAPPGR